MCVAQTAAPEGGSNNVSELSNGFPAVINALGGVSVLTKKAFANLLQGPKVKEKLVKTKAKSSQNGAKSYKNAPLRVTRRLWREKPSFFSQNVSPNGAKMEPKWTPKRAKIKFENEWIFDLAFSSISNCFWEAKVVKNHRISIPGGARKRKRTFSENVSFPIVKA